MELEPGQIFDGKYEIVRAIGFGGMGRIYEAVQQPMGRRVAIKLLHAMSVFDTAAMRLEREAIALAQLQHPGVVSVYGYGKTDSGPYLVMEYLEGTTLFQELVAGKPLGIDRTLSTIYQLCEAMAFTHDHGIIHRDLKPENIMLVDGGSRVKLIDLGLAKFLLEEQGKGLQKLTETNFAVGTVQYMSPEQCFASPDLDRRSDIYSVGMIMYECLTGKRAVDGPDAMAILRLHVEYLPPPLYTVLGDELPEGLQAVFDKATAKSVQARYQSMSDMVADLKLIRDGRGNEVAELKRSAEWTNVIARSTRSQRLVIAAAGSVAICVLALTYYFLPRAQDPIIAEKKERTGLEYLIEGNGFVHKRKYDKAIIDFEKSLLLIDNARGRPVELLAVHVGLAECYEKMFYLSAAKPSDRACNPHCTSATKLVSLPLKRWRAPVEALDTYLCFQTKVVRSEAPRQKKN